jgi:hypothetical protein
VTRCPSIYFLGLGNPATELRVIFLNAGGGCTGRCLVEIAFGRSDGLLKMCSAQLPERA